MKLLRPLVTLALVVMSTPAPARIAKHWSFAELVADSDLIAIVRAIEDTPASDLFKPDNVSRFVGINTRFHVYVVLKGKLDRKEVTVLHFSDEAVVANGPALADFQYTRTFEQKLFRNGEEFGWQRSPKKPQKPTWIAFLKARGDGRFEPVTGQYDSAESFCEVLDTYGFGLLPDDLR